MLGRGTASAADRPGGPSVRPPAVAGMFYPDDPDQCRRAARAYVQGSETAVTTTGPSTPSRWRGGIVPHAGWVCSAAIAGESIRAIAGSMPPDSVDVVVVFGAVHTPLDVPYAALDSSDVWAVPGGETRVAREVAERLLNETGGSERFVVDERLHRHEHAVEVELPLIQAAWPDAALLPVEVPLIDDAPEIGRRTAERVGADGLRAVFLASSDLTHYGPAYRFTPAGVGPEGLSWAKANDRRLLEVVTDLAAERVVPEVRGHANACGGGAIAAMLSACRATGASRAAVLRHANSYETLAAVRPQRPDDAVGYAAVVVG